MAEQTFEQWRAQYRDVFDRLEPRQAEILLDVCYSSWLENAAPSRRELEVLGQQVAGEISASQALDGARPAATGVSGRR